MEVEFMNSFARTLWTKLVRHINKGGDLDMEADGCIVRKDIQEAMMSLGYHATSGEYALVDYVVAAHDVDGKGQIPTRVLADQMHEKPSGLSSPAKMIADSLNQFFKF